MKQIPHKILNTAQTCIGFKIDAMKTQLIHTKDSVDRELIRDALSKLEAEYKEFQQFQIDLCNGEFDSNPQKGTHAAHKPTSS